MVSQKQQKQAQTRQTQISWPSMPNHSENTPNHAKPRQTTPGETMRNHAQPHQTMPKHAKPRQNTSTTPNQTKRNVATPKTRQTRQTTPKPCDATQNHELERVGTFRRGVRETFCGAERFDERRPKMSSCFYEAYTRFTKNIVILEITKRLYQNDQRTISGRSGMVHDPQNHK